MLNSEDLKNIEKIMERVIQARIEPRLDKLEMRMDKLESRMDNLESRMDNIEIRLDKVELRLDRIESRVYKLEKAVKQIKFDLNETIAFFDKRIMNIVICLERIDKRLGIFPLSGTIILRDK